jgi:hypothetical protein
MNDPEKTTQNTSIRLGNRKFNFSAQVVEKQLPYRLKDNPRVTVTDHGNTIIVDEASELSKELLKEICNKSGEQNE